MSEAEVMREAASTGGLKDKPTEPQKRALLALLKCGQMGGSVLGQAMMKEQGRTRASAQGLGRTGGQMAATLIKKGWAKDTGSGKGYRTEVALTPAGRAVAESIS